MCLTDRPPCHFLLASIASLAFFIAASAAALASSFPFFVFASSLSSASSAIDKGRLRIHIGIAGHAFRAAFWAACAV